MESFGHKMIISSQPVPLTGTGVLYPHVRDFLPICPIGTRIGYVQAEEKQNVTQNTQQLDKTTQCCEFAYFLKLRDCI